MKKSILGAILSPLCLYDHEILKHPSIWSKYSITKGKLDESPVFVGNVKKAYNLKVDNIQDIQTWGELLISTATSVLLQDAEELSSKHLTLAEQMWFREL